MKPLACLVLLLCAVPAFSAEKLSIAFRYNTVADDGKNFLRWQTDDTKTSDRFDAVTGASVAKSTKLLRALQEPDKKKAFPKGLYALLLFAVSPAAQAQSDGLTVEKDGARLTISFMHRGNAYRITTDEKGRLHTRTSFALAEHIADNTAGIFTIKPEFLPGASLEPPEKAEAPDGQTETAAQDGAPAAAETDGTRVAEEILPFVPDDYDESAPAIWDGTLKTAFADGVLTITGRLKRIAPPKKPVPAEAPASPEASAPAAAPEDESDATFTSEAENAIIEDETAP